MKFDRKAGAVGCIAGSTMGIELVQTRILSYLYYNHVVYLTVTVALLGFGVSGVLVALFSRYVVDDEDLTSAFAGAFAVVTPLSLAAAGHLPELAPHAPPLVKLLLSYLLLTPPFMLAGAALGILFMRNSRRMYSLYFADLAASAISALAFILLLRPLSGPGFIWLCTAVALAGFVLLSWSVKSKRVTLGYVVVVAVLYVWLGPRVAGGAPEHYKTLGRFHYGRWPTARFEASEWTPTSRIDVVSDPGRDLVFGTLDPDGSQTKLLTQDSDAFTVVLGPKRVQEIIDRASAGERRGSLDAVYVLNPAPMDALIVGVGGGIDIVKARAHGARSITGLEINPAIVSLLQGPYREYAVWPTWPNVREVRTEGRHYIRTTTDKYDTVVMSGIDTFAALSSGAYVLSENYLYTTEAMQDYLEVLKPQGTIAIFRWLFPQPRESLRLSSLFIAAARRMKLPHPEQSVMVIADDIGWSYRWATTLIKPRPFTADEVRHVAAMVALSPDLALVYVPRVLPPEEHARLEAAAFARNAEDLETARRAYAGLFTAAATSPDALAEFERRYPYRIDATFDERPFFFEYFKRGSAAVEARRNNSTERDGLTSIRGDVARHVLMALLLATTTIGAASMLGPLAVFGRQGLKTPGILPLICFVAFVGLGFMLVEIGLMQLLTLFLGDSTSTMAVVLAGLLLFSGIGSLVAGLLGQSEERNIAIGTIGAALLAALLVPAVHLMVPMAVGLPFVVRSAFVLGMLAPVGLAMGFPFASVVRYLGARYERFVPWAWGINGLSSVVASVVAIIAAMRVGFSPVILGGAALYLGSFVMFSLHRAAVKG
jgi:hypothetical protein